MLSLSTTEENNLDISSNIFENFAKLVCFDPLLEGGSLFRGESCIHLGRDCIFPKATIPSNVTCQQVFKQRSGSRILDISKFTVSTI